MMQLICRIEPADYDAWKAEFDAEAENIAAAGLSLLQFWRSADRPGTALMLFEVRDRKRAQAWLDKQAGFGRGLAPEFVETAF